MLDRLSCSFTSISFLTNIDFLIEFDGTNRLVILCYICKMVELSAKRGYLGVLKDFDPFLPPISS